MSENPGETPEPFANVAARPRRVVQEGGNSSSMARESLQRRVPNALQGPTAECASTTILYTQAPHPQQLPSLSLRRSPLTDEALHSSRVLGVFQFLLASGKGTGELTFFDQTRDSLLRANLGGSGDMWLPFSDAKLLEN